MDLLRALIALLLAYATYVSMMHVGQLNSYIAKDLMALATNVTSNTSMIVINFVSFNITVPHRVTFVITPFELKYLSNCLNVALRSLLSNGYNVTLVIKKNLTSVPLANGVCYCWGPACPCLAETTVLDNPRSSYAFVSAVLETLYGPWGLLEANILLKKGDLSQTPSALSGVYVNGKLVDGGFGDIPLYCNADRFLAVLGASVGAG